MVECAALFNEICYADFYPFGEGALLRTFWQSFKKIVGYVLNQLTKADIGMIRVNVLDESFGSTPMKEFPSVTEVPSLSSVAVLLCTYNGQDYLAQQLDSFASQSHPNWKVWVSDDGSQDDTRKILESYRQKWSDDRLSILSGPSKGFAANFLSLTCNSSVEADFYAYSDQDDVWDDNKLSKALRWLETVPADIPALYCARTRLVDANNKTIGTSPLFSKSPSFANALIQSIAGGNTMVFNNAARGLLCEAGENIPIITHDWWAYMVVTGCGGRVFYDPDPTLRYRQHTSNLVGTNSSWNARLKRIYMLHQGQLRDWNGANITALLLLRDRLTSENREKLQQFIRAREMSLIPRLIHLKRSGIYRQTLSDNLGLVVAAIFGKI